ncbi:MAG: hypothetical protein FRX49_10054 [Trebouxia sp. A1-2]|nr:MAG: hypothetical protein FRX49_10054 [Trebouxia sp. A1-2]
MTKSRAWTQTKENRQGSRQRQFSITSRLIQSPAGIKGKKNERQQLKEGGPDEQKTPLLAWGELTAGPAWAGLHVLPLVLGLLVALPWPSCALSSDLDLLGLIQKRGRLKEKEER